MAPSQAIRTVCGDITDVAGPVLMHEHLQIDLSANKNPSVVLGPEHEADIVSDLKVAATSHALACVVDLSVPGSGRDPVALKRMSAASGVAVVCATGFYWEPYPAKALESSVEELTALMIREVVFGIDGTDVRCGVIKVGTEPGLISEVTGRVFLAAAAASRATGACLVAHTSSLDQVAWQLETLQRTQIDPSRVLISHFGASTVSHLREVAAAGVFMGIDQIGFSIGPSMNQLADLVAGACEAGLARQLIISSDMARNTRLHRYGGTSYSTVFSEFVPLLKTRGVSEAVIDIMLRENPQRLLKLRGTHVSSSRGASRCVVPARPGC